MNSSEAPDIVVGVDGAPAGQAALEYAVRQAVDHSGTLTVVTVWNWGGARVSPVRGPRTRHATVLSGSRTPPSPRRFATLPMRRS
jgi:hypothetical protein